MFQPPPLTKEVPSQPISAFISRLCLDWVKSRSIRSFLILSAPNLTVRCWLWKYFSTRPCLYLTILPFPSMISSLPLYPILVSTRNSPRGKPNLLLSPFSTCFYVLNLQDVAFYNVSGKSIAVPNSNIRHTNITYFNIRSIVSTAIVVSRAPVKTLSNSLSAPYSAESFLLSSE